MNRIILILLVTFSICSCNNADDDIVFTAKQKKAYYDAIEGVYQGKYGVATIADEHLTWIDDVEVCVGGSSEPMILLYDVPFNSLADLVGNDTELGKLFEKMPPRDVACRYTFSNVKGNEISLNLSPTSFAFNANYDGKTHLINIDLGCSTYQLFPITDNRETIKMLFCKHILEFSVITIKVDGILLFPDLKHSLLDIEFKNNETDSNTIKHVR